MKHVSLLGVVAVTAVALAGCATQGQANATAPVAKAAVKAKVESVIPTPKDLLAITAPSDKNFMYLLAGTAKSKGLYALNLGTQKVSSSGSVTDAADAVALTSSGEIVLGEATSHTGAIAVVDATTLKAKKEIAVGAPVIGFATDQNTPGTLYVLNGTKKSTSVSVLDLKTDKVVGSVPVPLNTVAIASNSGTLYTLQPNGLVTGIDEKSQKTQFQFVVSASAQSMDISPDGQTLYMLKHAGSTYNVSVVDLATEAQVAAIGAPTNADAIAISNDGKSLYLGVKSPSAGNIQTINAITS